MSNRREQEAEEPADRRAWRPWVAGAVVAAAMVVIYVHDPKLLLEYFKVLVWPVALGALGWWLRDVLRVKAREVQEVTLPGAGLKFRPEEVVERVSEAASHNVAQPSEVLVARPTKDLYSAVSLNFHRLVEAETSEEERKREAERAAEEVLRSEQERRAAFEQTFKEGAEWGAMLARLGLEPKPRVSWDDDQPSISAAALGHDGAVAGYLRYARAVRAMRELERPAAMRAVLDELLRRGDYSDDQMKRPQRRMHPVQQPDEPDDPDAADVPASIR
ncbi:hypothetical protein GCM10023317_05330 [Actinopolymorpha pittospori]